MKSKCHECWNLARHFTAAGEDGRAAEAARLGHMFLTQERSPRRVEHDHEGSMARGELGSLLENAKSLHDMVGPDDELPGWVSAYITLASDYMNSVTQYMKQADADEDEDEEEEEDEE